MSETACPHCGSSLEIWDQSLLNTTFVCKNCKAEIPPKATGFGKGVKIAGVFLSLGAAAIGLTLKLNEGGSSLARGSHIHVEVPSLSDVIENLERWNNPPPT